MEKPGFFKWVLTNWLFWVLLILLIVGVNSTLWTQGTAGVFDGGISFIIGQIIGFFLIMLIPFAIYFYVKK